MSATVTATPRRSARLAALASKNAASPARTTSQEVPSAPKKAARNLLHSFTSVVPARIAIHMRPQNLTVSSWPKKEVYRENLIREDINNIIVRELDAAVRCIPDSHDVDQQTLFLYSFIVGPLLDSLTKPYANWDKIPLADVYNVMYYWRPAARPVSINNGMSAKFLHDWNICRDRMVQYGLTFP